MNFWEEKLAWKRNYTIESLAEVLKSKTDENDGCWTALYPPVIEIDGQKQSVSLKRLYHIFSFGFDESKDQIFLQRTCTPMKDRDCWNPDHIKWLTQNERKLISKRNYTFYEERRKIESEQINAMKEEQAAREALEKKIRQEQGIEKCSNCLKEFSKNDSNINGIYCSISCVIFDACIEYRKTRVYTFNDGSKYNENVCFISSRLPDYPQDELKRLAYQLTPQFKKTNEYEFFDEYLCELDPNCFNPKHCKLYPHFEELTDRICDLNFNKSVRQEIFSVAKNKILDSIGYSLAKLDISKTNELLFTLKKLMNTELQF